MYCHTYYGIHLPPYMSTPSPACFFTIPSLPAIPFCLLHSSLYFFPSMQFASLFCISHALSFQGTNIEQVLPLVKKLPHNFFGIYGHSCTLPCLDPHVLTFMSPALDPVISRLPVASRLIAVSSFPPWQFASLSTWLPLSTSHTLTMPPSHPLTICESVQCVTAKSYFGYRGGKG